ncbi:hypothetical protein ACWD9K_20040 [Streptomyces sp. 900116325]
MGSSDASGEAGGVRDVPPAGHEALDERPGRGDPGDRGGPPTTTPKPPSTPKPLTVEQQIAALDKRVTALEKRTP